MSIQFEKSVVAASVPFDNSTNGFTSTDVQAAIVEASTRLVASEVSATANDTTTSSTDSPLNSMTITPAAGTYMVWFGTTITSNSAGAAISISLYVGGAQKADSLRKITPLDGGLGSSGSSRGTSDINALVTVNGSQALVVQWSISSGTATCGPRTMNILRIL